MLTYRVYLWLSAQSLEAEVMLDVHAIDTTHALIAAMEHQSFSYVHCAWVISPDDETVDARAEDVFLLTFADAVEVIYVE